MSPKVFWVGFIVALLSMSVILYGIGAYLAISDPSFAVEPDYEEKAANWDEWQRLKQASDQLGWTIDLRTTTGNRRGEVDVRLELYDKWGKPIHDAVAEVQCFHNARAADVFHETLDYVGDQYYFKTMNLRRSGIWEFRLRVTREEDVFVKTVRKSVVAPR